MGTTRLWLFTSKATRDFWQADFTNGDCLAFGSENHGLPASLVEQFPAQAIRIPQAPEERCLNLSTAAGIGLFEALRHVRASQ
jgi:tRNA (cytidine/uridine-2'-O-)-methyltransferase